jgi:conjugative relaxase-like TrwC/TraI family protein
MVTISKPLSAAQVRTYHAEEFTNAQANYYTVGAQIRGQWHGRLAAAWGLSGDVDEERFQRLAEGQHPLTSEPLVHHQPARTYVNAHGETVTTVGHRAAWDATFSAPKSVSLTALVGGDDRVREAHRASVALALDDAERFVQARIGGHHPAETTGRWVAARFDHDSARPVEGYAAPQLHTHVVIFNVTERPSGETRALQPRELYRSQQYLTAVYRSELATRLRALGYEIERGASGQPEISGFTPAYLDASSPRRHQIAAHLANAGLSGAGPAQIAAHRTRAGKEELVPDDMRRRHRDLARMFGDQPATVVAAVRARDTAIAPHRPVMTAHDAVTFAKDRNFEREAVVDERALLRDALRRSMGELSVDTVRTEFERRLASDECIAVPSAFGAPARMVTTREMVAQERDMITQMRAGREAYPALVSGVTRHDILQSSRHLSDAQRAAVDQILASRDGIVALEGVAGAGKTTTLTTVRDAAERDGYRVEGLAPTSRAVHTLAEAGIPSRTLQRHLVQHEDPPDGRPRLYVVDESSLASTVHIHTFLRRLHADDRVLLVGDTRQHYAVEAGRPYHQLQDAGVQTVRLDDIVRQQDPALRQAVQHLSRSEIRDAVAQLEQHGRVHHIVDRDERLGAIARAYLQSPEATMIIAPDHASRRALNERIHHLLQAGGHVASEEYRARVLDARQDITGADRQWADHYARGEIVRYTVGSRPIGLRSGEYARIVDIDAPANRITVARTTGEQVTYDPRRLHGVTLFRETARPFATGDRVQFTVPFRERHVANRELGTLEHIHPHGGVRVRLDAGRRVTFSLDAYPHLDYGYAVTSHSSQGHTADRVLVHVDTAGLGAHLVNRRLAYVAVSRARYDAQIFTDDRTHLADALSRDVEHRSALEPAHPRPVRSEDQLIDHSPRAQTLDKTVGR